MVSSDVGGLGERQEWPPGFRFHPTDEELVLYYLKRKICRKKLKLNIIAETDVYKWDPEELPGLSILKTGDRQWFFFSPRDRKYPNGARSNRATRYGYWKATGKDRIITCNSRSVGVKKTLVFYRGRAPNGERTDWVMHEYTLDEVELQRCQNVQEYYALYKVFKKSGPGPKNGEQYGAPFREEEWNDDCPDFDNSVNVVVPVENVDDVLANADAKVDSLADDIEELLKHITEEPLLDLPEITDFAHNPPSQVVSKEDVLGAMVELPCREIIIQETVNALHASGDEHNEQASFELSQSAISQFQLHDAEVVFAPNTQEQEVYLLPEEDFLEMDDLLGPEHTETNVEKPLENFQFEETDGLCDFDLYHDAAMFLSDIGPNDQSMISYQYMNSVEQNGASQYDCHFESNPIGASKVDSQLCLEDADQINNQLCPDTVNQINYHYQFHPDVSETNDQERSVLTLADFDHSSHSGPTSGVVYDSSNFSLQANQNQSGNDDTGATSWFSSAIWSFVESIPTTPASAAENALVTRAFGRMSSFSRMRINVMNTNVSTGTDSETTKSSCRKRGFIFFPVLVAVIAILWVMIGTVRIWGSSITA